MRTALALAAMALVAAAGAASAHDAMLPLLLEEQAQAPPTQAPPAPQEPQAPTVTLVNPMSFWAALLGAALVTLGTLWWVWPRPAPAA